MPPQTQQDIQDPNYSPIDPQKNFLAFVNANKDAIQRMPEDKQLKFVDMLFRRFALPKYQKMNQQKPLDEDELDGLRLQFAARLLGIPMDQTTTLKQPEVKHGALEKGAAALESGGAGVIGGLKTIDELRDKLEKHVPIAGAWMHAQNLQREGKLGQYEGKAYSDAQTISPSIASAGAAVGHQIPAMIATEGAGQFPRLAGQGASVGLRALEGAGRGAAEGATYGATAPGQSAKQGAEWGGVLGAAFPLIGKLFGFGRSTPAKVATGVAEGEGAAAPKAAPQAAESTSQSLGDVANKVAKDKFGKGFKDLSSAEKAQMPSFMKEEIKKQQVIKAAQKKATVAAAKAGREAEETAKRAEKAKEATAKAAQQAEKRAGGSVAVKATAAKAAEENPQAQISEVKSPLPKHEVKAMTPFMERHKEEMAALQRTIDDPSTAPEAKKNAEDKMRELLQGRRKTDSGPPSGTAERRGITKVSPEATGKKVRAKGGASASPAQQAADRERIAAKREESKGENFNAALEKHAQQMAGRYTASSVGMMHVPEMEDAIKEMPNGEYMLKTLQKAKRAYKWNDEIYAESLKEWMLNQFEKK